MPIPRLYERYDRQEVVAFFGDKPEALSLCDGQWMIFPDVAICLTKIGEPPKMSHFATGADFFWVADKPYHVHDGRNSNFLPAQVIGSKAKALAIHLFVLPQDSQKYVYIGELEPSYMQQSPGPQNHGMARFGFKPTLPSSVWMQLGGLRIRDTDSASVDRVLERLRAPTTVQDRLEVLQRLVEYLHGPIRPEDGFSETDLASLRLPRPLKWWYGWAGKRNEIMSGQNLLLEPKKVREEDACLLFYVENQAVYRWGTLFEGDDPPVFGRYNDTEPWQPEGITLSEHLILGCIFEAIICHSPYGASAAWLDEQALLKIEQIMKPIAINPWRWLGPTRFYANNGAFMYSMSNGTDVYSVWIGAKTEGPLQFLKPFLDDAWEFTAV